MAEDELSLGIEFAAPTESRAELAMRSRIAARLDLDIGQTAQRIGRYEIVRRLGSGGMGVVYEARDPQLDRTVALKLLRPERVRDEVDGHERLHREARALAKLSHPNVVQIHEVSDHEGVTYVAMELVRGQTLHEWQRAHGPALAEILSAYRQAGLGLAAAHAAGIVHRDFKPSNALIGDDGRVRVVDFGLARGQPELGDAITMPTREGNSSTGVAGTPGYIAPEILGGRGADARSDQFSFCVALWEAVSGQRPSAQPRGRRGAGVNPRFSGPAWLRRALLRGLAEEPGDRWPELHTLLRILDRRPRQKVWLVLGLPVLGLAVGLFLEPMLTQSLDPCADLSREFDRIWNADASARLGSRLAALGRTGAETDLLVRALDNQRARWLETEDRVCESTHINSSWSPDLSEAASRCLDANLQQSRELIALFGPAIDEPPASVRALVAQLADPRGCANTDVLARRPFGDDRALVTLRQSIARTRMLLAGEMVRGDDESQRLLALARELRGQKPDDPATEWTLAEALELRAEVEQWRQRPDLAWPLLREAMPLARRSGDVGLELRCLHRMAYLAAEQLEDPERAADLVALATGVVSEVEDLAHANFDHAMVRAALARSERRYTDAESILRVAIDDVRDDEAFAGLGSDRARLRLANVLAEQDKLDDALTIYAGLAGSTREQVGDRSVELGLLEFNWGLTLYQRGVDEDDIREAERHLRRALDILQQNLGPNSVRLSPTLSVLAEIELNDGRLDLALQDAERAWVLQRDQLPRGHGDRGQALKVVGYVHSLRGDYDAALAAYEQMAEVIEIDTADEEAALAHIIGWTKCRVDRCSEARTEFEAALAKTSAAQTRVYATVGLANADIADAKPEAAIQRIERLQPLVDSEFAGDVELHAEIDWLLARALVDAGGDRKRATAHLRRAVDGYGELHTPEDIATDLERIAKVLNVE